MQIQVPSCDFTDCKKCLAGNCKSLDDYRNCKYAINKSMLKAYQEECSIETEQKRIIKELDGLPEYVVSERNGFKRTYIEKERAIHIVENMPFL